MPCSKQTSPKHLCNWTCLYEDLGASRQGQPDPTASLHSKEYLQTPLSSRIQLTGADKAWWSQHMFHRLQCLFSTMEKCKWEGRENAVPSSAIRTPFDQLHLSLPISLLQPQVLWEAGGRCSGSFSLPHAVQVVLCPTPEIHHLSCFWIMDSEQKPPKLL